MFQEEQIIKGSENCLIPDLNEFCEMVVLEVNTDNNTVLVEVIDHEYNDNIIGDEYWVPAEELSGVPTTGTAATGLNYVPSLPVSTPPVANTSDVNTAILIGVI